MNPGTKMKARSTGTVFTLTERARERTKSKMVIMYYFISDKPNIPPFSMSEAQLTNVIEKGIFEELSSDQTN